MAKCIRCGKKGLLLRVNSEGLCETCAQEQLSAMRAAMTPEQREYVDMKDELFHLQQKKDEVSLQLSNMQNEVARLNQEAAQKKNLLIQMDE